MDDPYWHNHVPNILTLLTNITFKIPAATITEAELLNYWSWITELLQLNYWITEAELLGLTTWVCPSVLEAGSCSSSSASGLWKRLKVVIGWGPIRSWYDSIQGQRSLHWVQVKHGRLQLCQLDGRDAHSPDVTQLVISSLLLHSCHLRGHPENVL